MSEGLLAAKGEAEPSAFAADDVAARFGAARRIITLAPLDAPRAMPAPDRRTGTTQPPVEPPGPPRCKFTFRLDPAHHAAFKSAAGAVGLSRQRFLMEALDIHLARIGRQAKPRPIA